MFHPHQSPRRGFTLVELLVVIAIIGVLIALLLPAVQAAREAARRMQCSNNFKQAALSLHNYHDILEGFPASKSSYGRVDAGVNGTAVGVATLFSLLPFMEQTARYETMLEEMRDSAGTGYPWTSSTTSLRIEAFRATISPFVCPSDGKMREPGYIEWDTNKFTEIARSSIVVSLGDALWQNGNSNEPVDSDGDVIHRGVFAPMRWKSFGSITDGTSNTIGLSEIVGTERSGNGSQSRAVLGGVAYVPAIYNGTLSVPGPCLLARSPGDPTQIDAIHAVSDAWRGAIFTDGRSMNTAFTTHLPPNSPSCSYVRTGGSWGVYSVSSHHPGGVNIALMDGSCRFVSNTVDTDNLDTPLDPKGPSPYGVWGALGTPSGGEAKSL